MPNMFGGAKINKPQKDNSKISKLMGGLAEKYKGQASGDILHRSATAGMGSNDSPMSKSIGKSMGKGLSMPSLKKGGKKGGKKSGFKGFKI